MAQKKAHEVESWLARPEAGRSIVLIYGPDRGMVAERAQKLAASTGMSADDPFSVVRLDAADIDQAPGRLLEEARTLPMFSDRRLIWIRNATATSKTLADEVRELAADPVPEALVLIEAGELRKGTSLRTVAEAAEAAIALPCYPDEARDLDTLIDETLQAARKSIGLEARQAVKRNLGGDRLASRGELEKLVLYAHDRPAVELDDVLAVLGDVAGQSSEDAVDAVLDGRTRDFDLGFARLAARGQAANGLLGAALRQFQGLQLLRAAMDEDGRGAASAVASAKPPVFFARRRLVEQALTRWDERALARALASLQAAILQARKQPALADAVARQALLALALESARRSR
jgi:DNA polymerase III subunit delta